MKCSVEGCENSSKGRGWCSSHYMRWRRYGDPLGVGTAALGRPLIPVASRFWSKVDFSNPDGCWPWKGSMRHAYPEVWVDGRKKYAHRVAFYLVHGEWPPEVCHHCDNPSCCRPDHLFGGTHAENMADMRAKGRGCDPPPRMRRVAS